MINGGRIFSHLSDFGVDDNAFSGLIVCMSNIGTFDEGTRHSGASQKG
jgi:hypothetical protein